MFSILFKLEKLSYVSGGMGLLFVQHYKEIPCVLPMCVGYIRQYLSPFTEGKAET